MLTVWIKGPQQIAKVGCKVEDKGEFDTPNDIHGRHELNYSIFPREEVNVGQDIYFRRVLLVVDTENMKTLSVLATAIKFAISFSLLK
jgi:hypothetical protein